VFQPFSHVNNVDAQGNPAGGWAEGTGFRIDWQDGPLGRGDARKEPNGAFVETIIEVVRQRLDYYQKVSGGRFSCDENRWAMDCLTQANSHLQRRTAGRESRGVEGTHQP
jgi:hypothetical protein